MPAIRIETIVRAKREVVFDLSRSIDLHKLSTSDTDEQAIAGVTTGLIKNGEWVTWRAKHFGVYQNLTSVITECRFPTYFVDEMKQGAFKRFRHEHIFEVVPNGTKMIDVFDYTSPFGILGLVADKLFLEKYMTRFLKKRNNTIKEFAENKKWKDILPK